MNSDSSVLDRPQLKDPTVGSGGCAITVLNDDHNSFEGVAAALARVLPGVDYSGGMKLANAVHSRGSAKVWSGVREVGELYWMQLRDSGLTMAPLE